MPTATRQFDVVVLGAGAAGLMAAATAGQRGRRVALIDHNPQPGRKILISGGGRANFTNLNCAAANYISANPHFAKSALALYRPEHFLELMASYRIPWHEKTLGQLFCDRTARDLLDMLVEECRKAAVESIFSTRILSVERGTSGGFLLDTAQGEIKTDALIIATGGLSIPKIGATGFGYEIARKFGLRVVPTRPALVPLTLAGDERRWTSLAGLAVAVEARAGKASFRENLLVTHRGLSGPAILQASSYWQPGEELLVDFAPGSASQPKKLLAELIRPQARRDASTYRKALRLALPERLATFLAEESAPKGWTNAALERAEERLHAFDFHPSGTEGYAKAEVTAGGVDTRDLEARTMEARSVPGLFFAGEVVDVTGWLGGYNFQWAWASGAAAGRAL
jgi:hypothetical protein